MNDLQRFERSLEQRLLAHVSVVDRTFDTDSVARAAVTRAASTGSLARLRGRGLSAPTQVDGLGRSPRQRLTLAFVAMLLLALVGGALVVGSRLSSPPADPLGGLITVPVEPGVERVVSDGIRDLVFGTRYLDELAIGPDGSVWLIASPALFRLGDPRSHPSRGDDARYPKDATYPKTVGDLKTAPDGTLWARPEGRLHRYDGERWSMVTGTRQWAPFDVGADGTVWSASDDGISRLDPSGWTEYSMYIDMSSVVASSSYAIGPPDVESLGVDADGIVWVALPGDAEGRDMLLLRFDGEAWSVVNLLGMGSYWNVALIDIGPEGTLWVYLEPGTADAHTPHLARFDGERWAAWSEEDAVHKAVWRGESSGLLRVGRDGEVWIGQISRTECRGIRRFDGTTWSRFLDGDCVLDAEVGPDGGIWVVTGPDNGNQTSREGLYRIDPKARAGGS